MQATESKKVAKVGEFYLFKNPETSKLTIGKVTSTKVGKTCSYLQSILLGGCCLFLLLPIA